jgi:hypothetical protein
MKSIMKAFIMLIILGISMGTVPIVTAQENATNNTPTATPTVTPTQTPTVVQPTVTTPVVTVPTVVATTEVKEGKFRVGPTVRIRPLNDVISKDQDGLIELYMDNPSLNEVTLSVDARISVPSGIHVYGQSFGEAGAAGMVYGKFEVPPGSARTINIVIKAEKIGDFSAQFSGLYWPGNNKDAYQPISLTHPFKVTTPSKDPLKDTSGDGDKGTPEKTPEKSPGISIVVAISIVAIMAYMLRIKGRT